MWRMFCKKKKIVFFIHNLIMLIKSMNISYKTADILSQYTYLKSFFIPNFHQKCIFLFPLSKILFKM